MLGRQTWAVGRQTWAVGRQTWAVGRQTWAGGEADLGRWGGRLGRWGGRPGRWGGRLGWLEGGLVRWGSWSGEQLFWPEHRSCVMVAGGSVERASRRLAMEGTPRPFPEGGIFRPMRSGGDQGTVSPRSIQTLTSARSAGVTPWIRPAWPRLWGRMLASLIWASRLRPGILEKSSHAGT